MRTHHRLVALVTVGLLALGSGISAAQSQEPNRLTSASGHVTFDGKVKVAGAAAPEVCTPLNCVTTTVAVALPRGVWQRSDDGLQVSIRWGGVDDEFDLYVYGPNGKLAASANQLDTNAQSVVIPHAANGTYRIVTAAKYFSSGSDAAFVAAASPREFDGTVHVHRGVLTSGKARPLLPAIAVVPPHNFHLSGIPPIPSLPIGYRFPSPVKVPTSCYLEETAQDGAQRCLRFDNELANVGAGELTLRFRWDGASLINNCRMQQVVHWTDGHVTYRDAGPCTFHLQHGHFHYLNMGRFYLYGVDGHGHRDRFPTTESKKVGFCAIDVDYFGFGRPDTAPRVNSFPTCNLPSQVQGVNSTEPGIWEYMGIGRGWGDIYTWDLPSQYIEISNVADGVYDLVSVANPDHALLEADDAGGTAATRIRLTGKTVTVIRAGVDEDGHPTPDPRARF